MHNNDNARKTNDNVTFSQNVVAASDNGKFAIIEDFTLTTLNDQEMIVDMPVGNYYFTITVQNNGVLKTIPGKMSVTFDSESNHNKAVITINQTNFTMDDEGYFTINAFKTNL